jgi:hypothetical protein
VPALIEAVEIDLVDLDDDLPEDGARALCLSNQCCARDPSTSKSFFDSIDELLTS